MTLVRLTGRSCATGRLRLRAAHHHRVRGGKDRTYLALQISRAVDPGPFLRTSSMALYTTLPDDGFTDIVHTDTLTTWAQAERSTPSKQPILTKAIYYGKKDGKSFRLRVERYYPNRSSELSKELITLREEVSDEQYNEAIAARRTTQQRW